MNKSHQTIGTNSGERSELEAYIKQILIHRAKILMRGAANEHGIKINPERELAVNSILEKLIENHSLLEINNIFYFVAGNVRHYIDEMEGEINFFEEINLLINNLESYIAYKDKKPSKKYLHKHIAFPFIDTFALKYIMKESNYWINLTGKEILKNWLKSCKILI